MADDRELLLKAEGSEDDNRIEMDPVFLTKERKSKVAHSDAEESSAGKLKRSCVCIVGVSMTLLVGMALALAVGLFVGQSLGRRAAEKNKEGTLCTTQLPDTQPPNTQPPADSTGNPPYTVPPSNTPISPYNWGSNVTSSGVSSSVFDWFADNLQTDDIRNYLSKLTASPHIAGSTKNKDLAVDIYNEWKNYGFDSVELLNYTVLLSYPNKSNSNTLHLINETGNIIYVSHINQEPPLTPGEDDPDVAAPFNAYSGSGQVTGLLVYVNYGRIEDFFYLQNNLSLDLSQYICIARYGAIFRGDKAHIAQRFGCKGLLIYSDPWDYAPEGVPVYPHGPSLPTYGVQRGTVMIMDGDPLTPGIPAIPGVYRRPYVEVQNEGSAPRIPVQPISYGDALHFMDQLTVFAAPDEWIGGLGINYSLVQSNDSRVMTELVVNNYQEERVIYNVVATLYGAVEPDRQVVLGNHRDAWVFGAVDPNSGTATLMALAKVIGQLRSNDWRPGRTMVLCSWDAEEYGLLGSTEWVEDFGKLLGTNTVAYLNVDSAVEGSRLFRSLATPFLYEVMWQASKMVQCPNPEFDTVYDEWLNFTSKDYNGMERPHVYNLGSGSDYTAFIQTQGISCTSMSYGNLTSYDVYHSVHDNFYWMSHYGDPDFTHHQATGLVWMNTALLLVTSPVIPSKPTLYSFIVEEIFSNLQKEYGDVLNQNGITLEYLHEAVMNFSEACSDFEMEMMNVTNSADEEQQLNIIRILNDKLMNVERAFIHPEDLPGPGRSFFKHVIFAPSSVNSYGSSAFPGISDTIFNATHPQMDGDWDKVNRQIDIVRTHLRYASQILKQPSLAYAPRTDHMNVATCV